MQHLPLRDGRSGRYRQPITARAIADEVFVSAWWTRRCAKANDGHGDAAHRTNHFRRTLEAIDDFTVGLRDAEGYYRSFPRDAVKVDIQDPLAAHVQLLRQYTDKNFHDILAYLVTLK